MVSGRPAYAPKAQLNEPGDWDTDDAAWKTPANFDEAAILASSMLQHRLSRRVWKRLREDNLTVADLATVLHQSKGQLWRKLAGTHPAGLVDLCLWAALTNDEALDVVADAFEGQVNIWPQPRR